MDVVERHPGPRVLTAVVAHPAAAAHTYGQGAVRQPFLVNRRRYMFSHRPSLLWLLIDAAAARSWTAAGSAAEAAAAWGGGDRANNHPALRRREDRGVGGCQIGH